MEETIMEKMIFVCIALFIIFYQYQRYKKLYRASRNLMCKHYATIISEEMERLNEHQGKEEYQEIFVARTEYLKDVLKQIPKNIKNESWHNAVGIHDSKQPRAICSDGVWGRAIWYNSIKKAINAG